MTDDSSSSPDGAPDIEARLRHALVAKAGDEPAHGADWGDLAGRLASSTRRRQRVLAGVAALALLVGAGGGYLGEAAAAPGPLAARAPGAKANSENSASPATTTAPRAPSPSAGAMAVCPQGSSAASGAAGGVASTDIGTATRLFVRTTSDGVTVRVYRDGQSSLPCIGAPTPASGSGGTGSSTGSSGSSGSSGPSGSTASTIGPLLPVAQGDTVELSDADAVGQGAISSTRCLVSPGAVPAPATNAPAVTAPNAPPTEPPTTTPATATPPVSTTVQPSAVVPGVFGVSEGDPVWWVALEVPSTVSSVRMAFPDGVTDQMVPVGGVAVLAHRVPADVATAGSGPYEVRGSADLLGPDGAVLGTVTLPQAPSVVPGPVPLPVSGGAAVAGGAAVSPGVIAVCPSATGTPPAQSSGSTENR